MAVLEFLARDHTFEVSSDNATYTTISGVKTWTWKESSGVADGRTFDDGGNMANLVVNRGVTVAMIGLQQVDAATGDRDAGQAAVEASMGNNFGVSRFRYYRIKMMGTSGTIGQVVVRGSAKLQDVGGGNDDLMPWGVEVEVYGRPVMASGVFNDLY